MLPLAMLAVMLAAASFTGKWPTSGNPYCSYTLQALAWLEGRLDLTGDYSWLELAVYEGKTYVSFPPFPSVVLLPFAAVFGRDTPDHIISLAFTCAGVVLAMRLYEALTGERERGAFFALYLYLANGYLFIAMQGWVWYLAQVMSFTLSLAALLCAAKGRGGAALALMACAFGCRPMVIVYLPMIAWLIVRHDGQISGRRAAESMVHIIRKKWCWAVVPLLIGGVYMALNFARFGNPFEFGHTYLPEFQRAELGQFSLSYAQKNFAQLFRLPTPGEGGALRYDTFDCMAFWLIAPMWVTLAAAWAYALVRRRRECGAMLVLAPLMLGAHLLIVCCHRTLGGYQFGNRYLVDMLPFAYAALAMFMPRGERFAAANVPLFFMGFAVNLIGTVGTYNHWL